MERSNSRLTPPLMMLVAAVARIALMVYGDWQDKNLNVKYTDIDYEVYTDASRMIALGHSPFERTTFRYTPLLAYFLLPNIYIHKSFGKVLFITADLVIGLLIYLIMRLRRAPAHICVLCSAVWLFHPLAINVSTRGNADSLIGALVLGTLYLLMKQQLTLSAVVFGLAVHFKIYPVIYGPSFLVLLDSHFRGNFGSLRTSQHHGWLQWATRQVTADRAWFFAVSAGTFFALTAVCYYHYGFEFLYETYLYHFVRTDNRHNFSLYFYDIYLRFDSPSRVGMGLLTFLPQAVLLVAVSILYGRDPFICLYALTVVFVAFNKVCTAQYFLWYLSLIPLLMPTSRMGWRRACGLVLLWLSTEVHWLYWGFQLEFLGRSVFFQLWGACAVFFISNTTILTQILCCHQFVPLFTNGRLTTLRSAPLKDA